MNIKNSSARPFSNIEISAFCGQLAMILKSGLPALEGISIMLEDASSEEERQILQGILDRLMMSGSLCQALAESGLFPPYMLHMVEIGEETGTMDQVMQALSDHYAREDAVSRSIHHAVTYPLIMAGVMILVILVLLVKVMPIFQQVFLQLGSEMTGISRILLDMGTAINRYSLIFILLLVLLMALLLYGSKTASGRKQFLRLGYRLKFTRTLLNETAACRFASGMALTLSSGLNQERSMELVRSLNEDPEFEKKLAKCQEEITRGEDLSAALHEAGIFSGVYSRLAAIGGKTGAMDQVMKQLAERYQDDIDSRMERLLSVLEPTLVIILSLAVGVILLSVMLPLTGIMSSL